jgi:hypothetical protein
MSILGDGNSVSMVQRAEEELAIMIELPGKNIEAARIIVFMPKSPKKIMTGQEQVAEGTSGPVSPMASSRVFSILGI